MFKEFPVGNGKILQGDCLDVLKTLPENEVVLAFTSPPYLNAINYEEHVEKLNGKKERWERKEVSYDEYKQFLKDRFKALLRAMRPGGHNVVNISPVSWNGERTALPFHFVNWMEEIGWKFREDIIWEKDKDIAAFPEELPYRMIKLFSYVSGTNFNFKTLNIATRIFTVWKSA